MGWKFWGKKIPAGSEAPETVKKIKLSGPKDLPQPVGRHLVVNLKQDPDWVWNLRGVVRAADNSKTRFFVRVFNPEQAHHTGISVRNYDTLADHSDLILYEGWYDKSSGKVEIEVK